jgi:hypothetical protein
MEIVLLAVALGADARAQVPLAHASAPDTTVTDQFESLFESEADDDSSALYELLEDLRARPLDVNTASADELAQIPAISPRLAIAIVELRDERGGFGTVGDIRRAEGMTTAAYRDALPFLVLSRPASDVAPDTRRYPAVPSLADVRSSLRVDILQRVQRRLDNGRGYDPVPDSLVGTDREPSRYLGTPERLYTRVRATAGRQLSVNLTLEKDPGEPFTWDPASGFYGYDFVSFHASAQRIGRIESLVLGDFVAEFGQGVLLWRASGFGKGRETVRPLVRRGRGLRPYTSTDEVNFFRGGGATVAVAPSVFVTGFASRRLVDARFSEPDSAAGGGITVVGRPTTGLHRTRAEIARKRALGQTVLGGAAEFRARRVGFGLAAYHATFDALLSAGSQPYQRFDFSGDRATMVSAFGGAVVGGYHLFGEIGRAPAGAVGGVAGIEGDLGPLNTLVMMRHYPRDFVSLLGYGFGERNGATQNETGVYLGLAMQPSSRWRLTAFVDQYRFPWARFGVPRPGAGFEGLLSVEHRPRPWLLHYVHGRSETRDTGLRVSTDTGAEMDGLTRETRQTLRWQGEYAASARLRLRARLEGARYRRQGSPAESGVMIFQDIRWSASRVVAIDGRLTFFDTESFDSRLFQFESDLHGVLANTLLSGRGTRTYVVLTVRPGGTWEGLDVRLKGAVTRYRDRFSVGSGLDEIEGDRVRDVGVHVRFRF